MPAPIPPPSAELLARIEAAASQSTPVDIAAAICGVKRETLRGWCAKARAGDERYQAVDAMLQRVESRVQATYLELLRNHAERDWRAAAWVLERGWPNRWGPRPALPPEAEDEDVEVSTDLWAETKST